MIGKHAGIIGDPRRGFAYCGGLHHAFGANGMCTALGRRMIEPRRRNCAYCRVAAYDSVNSPDDRVIGGVGHSCRELLWLGQRQGDSHRMHGYANGGKSMNRIKAERKKDKTQGSAQFHRDSHRGEVLLIFWKYASACGMLNLRRKWLILLG